MRRTRVDGALMPVVFLAGAAVGAVGRVAWAGVQRWRMADRADVADLVVDALRRDALTADQPLDVDMAGEGIVEISGMAASRAILDRAMTVAQGVPGVEAVVQQATIGRLDDDGDRDEPARREGLDVPAAGGRWEGRSVGMGARRQGRDSIGRRRGRTAARARQADTPQGVLRERAVQIATAQELGAPEIPGAGNRATRVRTVYDAGVPRGDHVPLADSLPRS